MINLYLAEQNRLLSRRVTSIFPGVLAILIVLGSAIVWVFWRRNAGPDTIGIDFVGDFLNASGEPDVINLDGTEVEYDPGTSLLTPIGFLLPIVGFVIGASYYGADEKSGMIEHLLTWEPRRIRFLVARSLAGVTTMFVISSLLSALWVACLWVLATLTGTTEGMTAGLWGDVGLSVFRAGAMGEQSCHFRPGYPPHKTPQLFSKWLFDGLRVVRCEAIHARLEG